MTALDFGSRAGGAQLGGDLGSWVAPIAGLSDEPRRPPSVVSMLAGLPAASLKLPSWAGASYHRRSAQA